MSRKYIIFALLLLFIVVLLGVENYEVWNHPFEVTVENGPAKKQEKTPEPAAAIGGSQKGTNSTASYAFIAGKNIFNPERKDFPAPLNASSKASGRPQVVLYGVTLAGDYQSAFVTNPETKSPKMGNKEQMIVKLGERIGQYKLAKVLSDRITLEANGDTFEVLLHDPKMPKRRVGIRTETKPATVTSTVASSTPTGEVKKEGTPAQQAAQSPSSSRPTRTEAVRTAAREPSEEPKESSPVPTQPQPGAAQPPSGGEVPTSAIPAAPTPVPAPMVPTAISPGMVPRSVPVPPGMGTPARPLSITPSQTPVSKP